jgi:hypothetical protein
MRGIILLLILVFFTLPAAARKTMAMPGSNDAGYTSEAIADRSAKMPVVPAGFMPVNLATSYYQAQAGHINTTPRLIIGRHRKSGLARQDVKRESGAYFFDTVYKLRVPASRQFNISINAGYTYYNSYVFGRRPNTGNNSGMLGGLSFMRLGRTNRATGADGSQHMRTSFFRISTDLVSYGNTKSTVFADRRKTSLLDKYTQDLSARLYIDGRITYRKQKAAISIIYLLGVGVNMASTSFSSPVIIGAGVGYRFL